MRISAIQSQVLSQPKQMQQKKANNKISLHTNNLSKNLSNPTFKGDGKGFLIGAGTGSCIGLCLVFAGAVTGILVIPTVLSGVVAIGSALGGGYVGNKIEDAFSNKKK